MKDEELKAIEDVEAMASGLRYEGRVVPAGPMEVVAKMARDLDAIVSKLPSTKDRTPILPSQKIYWLARYGKHEGTVLEMTVSEITDGIAHADYGWDYSITNEHEDFYSTREAAAAALASVSSPPADGEGEEDDEPEIAPLECLKCGKANGPPHPVDEDHEGYICPACYRRLQKK